MPETWLPSWQQIFISFNPMTNNDSTENQSSFVSRSHASQPILKAGCWHTPATITPNNFVHKSLSTFAYNVAVGCDHGCRFCYVPSASTIKLAPFLEKVGVNDPDAEWGNYVFVRLWDEPAFVASLEKAEATPLAELKADGNRAVMMCSTTDPYQIIRNPDAALRKDLQEQLRFNVRRALELILAHSTLNVRILTRSPLARADFDLYRQFGPRLMFGMSIPTMRNDLAKIYEPKAPAPTQRLETLKAANEAGLNVYVAVAPTYPECDEADLYATLKALSEVEPFTIFHEPINIRAKNIERIAEHAATLGLKLKTDVFQTPEAWQDYAVNSLRTVHTIARDLGIENRLHLWPDKSLGTKKVIARMIDPEGYQRWVGHWWNRISEWPQR
jgi:DNA repair photolyase